MAIEWVAVSVSLVIGLGGLAFGWYELRIARIERSAQYRMTLYLRQLDAYSEISKLANSFTDVYTSNVIDSSIEARVNIAPDTIQLLSDEHWKLTQYVVLTSPLLSKQVRNALDTFVDVCRMLFGERQITIPNPDIDIYKKIFESKGGSVVLGAARTRLNEALKAAAGTERLAEELKSIVGSKTK